MRGGAVSNTCSMLMKAIAKGVVGMLSLLALYFTILTLVSGWEFAANQFAEFWYFVIALALGFGMQIGLYSWLKNASRGGEHPSAALAVSGTTSTAAMISCCAHYLANILPIIATTGALAFIAGYQTELFWIGLAFNAAGIGYIGRKTYQFMKHSPPHHYDQH